MRLLSLDPRPGRPVRGLRFAADGRSLAAVVGRPNDPRRRPVWFDLHRGITFEPFPPIKAGRVADPVFAPDPRLVAETLLRSDDTNFVILTDGRGGVGARQRLGPDAGELFGPVAFSADGGTLFVARGINPGNWTEDGEEPNLWVVRLDVANWLDRGDPDRIDDELRMDESDLANSFADTGAGVLAVGTKGGQAVLYDLIASETLLSVEHTPGVTDPPPVDAVLFNPDGRHLVTRSAGTLAVWDALTGRELARPAGRGPFADCAFTPDGRSLLAVGLDTGVSRFDAPRYGLGERLEFGHGALHSVAVSPDGLTAAAGIGHGAVLLFDL